MKRFFYILLTILAAILVFGIITFLFIQNKGRGAIQVTSTPNAKVYLDGKLIGNSPLCKCDAKNLIAEGEHIVKVVATSGNYEDFNQTINVYPNTLTVVDKTFAAKGFDSASIISLSQISDKNDSQISVETFPQHVQVFLDGSSQGQSPVLLKNIKVADHELKISKNGYEDKIIRVRTVSGFKLDALIYLGLNTNLASSSGAPVFPGVTPSEQKILILDTPTGFLRVRDQASLDGNEIGQAKPGETYQLLDEQDGWYQIQFNSQKGWISSQYAKKQ